MPTKTKESKSALPGGWDLGEPASTRVGDDTIDVLTAVRTYPDGTARDIVAHSEQDLAQIATDTDAQYKRNHAQKHAALTAEAKELSDKAKALREQAKLYDWAI